MTASGTPERSEHADDLDDVDDAERIDRWYREQRARLVAVLVVVTGNQAEAEECADEAVVRAFERWDERAPTEATFGWLVTVAMNVFRRSRRRQGLFGRFAARQPPTDVSADPDFSVEMLAAIGALAPRQREAIALRYVLELPVAEIARVMAVAEGTVTRTLFDARRLLAIALGDELAVDSQVPDEPESPRADNSSGGPS